MRVPAHLHPLALCWDSYPHKDTLSKPLPFHFLSPCAVGALKSVSFSVFFPPILFFFTPLSNTDVGFSSIPQCLLFTLSVNMCQVGQPWHSPSPHPLPFFLVCAKKPRCCFIGYGFYIFYSQPLIFLDLQIQKNSHISRLDMHTP